MEGTKIINNALMDVDSQGNVLGNHFEPDEDSLFKCFMQNLEYENETVAKELRRLFGKSDCKNSNPFFENAKNTLLRSLISFQVEKYPDNPKEHSFRSILRLLDIADTERKKSGSAIKGLDPFFKELEEKNPESDSVILWNEFKTFGPRICNEVIIVELSILARCLYLC